MTVIALPSSSQKGSQTTLDRLSPFRLWAVTSVNLAYGFMMADQGILLAPLEAEHLFGERASLGLALMAVCCGLSQLSGPAAGRWSDRHRSQYGRRRPCLVRAMVAVWLFTAFVSASSNMKLRVTFVLVFLCQQLAWNCVQTVQAGLVPDVVPADQRGAAGGAAAANTLAGALLALLCVRFQGGLGLESHYALCVTVGILCVAMASLSTNETPTNNIDDSTADVYDPLTFVRHLKSCYEFDPHRYPQFAKLLLSKTLYCSSVMVKGFLLFFIQDTFKLRNFKKDQAIVGDTCVSAEALAACSAIAAMALLDAASAEISSGRLTKKREDEEEDVTASIVPPTSLGSGSPASLLHPTTTSHTSSSSNCCSSSGNANSGGKVSTGCAGNCSGQCAPLHDATLGMPEDHHVADGAMASLRARSFAAFGAFWMSLLWLGPPLVGFGVLRETLQLERSGLFIDHDQLANHWSPYMVLGTGIWGIGQGIYLAGDQALSFALLPDPEEASRLLGLTSVCSAAGAVFGGSATGLLLYTFGSLSQDTTQNVASLLQTEAGASVSPAPGYGFAGYAAMFALASALSGSSCFV
eukprot:CAMPEP_0206586134 /NCGR_PEP_ID=MMETSP0325_2-20121206/36834_1 /ASSEMBLY_ACC=CAM_ASM_000347 /TAXON_ID=2866 /ORGANISM="Crypthecodinium cohnii, Strain Seligo" /LENGTH=580 /DNA_ID=CAMNT_0054093819 /DNA_START=129 /DNA_END=1868 /DNA_ORIENTATION=+